MGIGVKVIGRGLRRDAGQNMLEYVGIVITVAAVVVIIGSANGLGILPKSAEKAVCKVINSQQCREEGLAPKTDEDFKPDFCEVQTTQETHKGTINLGIVKLGQDWTLQKVKVQTKDGKTKYRVMMTAGGQAGVEGGFGFDATKVGAEVKVGADATFGHGDMWEFQSQEEMDKFSEGLHQAWLDNIQMNSGDPGYGMGMALRDDEPLPDPKYKIAKGGIQALAEGEFKVPTRDGETDPQTGKPKKQSEAKIKIKPSGEVTTMTNGQDGSTVTTQQFKFEGTGTWPRSKGDKVKVNRDLSHLGSSTGAMTIIRDKSGKITEIKFVQTVEAGMTADGKFGAGGVDRKGPQGQKSGDIKDTSTTKGVAVVTKSLKVDDGNRATVDQWLSSNNDAGTVAATMADAAFSAAEGAEYPPGPDADPMEKLLYENGKTTRAMYANHTEALEISAKIRLGWTLGFSFSSERSDRRITDGDYLGAPDPTTGVREYIDFPECAV
ncbi:MAG: hypothetical protein GEV11_20230 [Streptosporangiales bacterium]|nr:hypothetical protein [Streptosporangiales bacterium]